MLRTLVYLDADLASSIALRYICQLAQFVDIKLHSVHVEEPDQDGHAPGTGWVRRTWESTVLKTGEFEIAQLIKAEKSSCPKLGAPKMLIGDRENEILREIQKESYDLFVEGSLHSFTAKKLYDKIHSRLYRLIPCPVIIVKNLVNIEKVALIVRNEIESKKFISMFLKIFKGAKLKLDLVSCEFQEPGQLSFNAKKEINGTLSAAEEILVENKWPPENCLTIQGAPEEIADVLRDYGLVVSPLHHTISKKSNWFQLLNHIPSPILICWQ
ncbi:MAG: universal stress protein [Desulfobacteraceae bacterium]|nr:universal stress protein [Desulfobacteraceae bacterium]